MFTVDASVWLNADSPAELNNAESRTFIDHVAASSIRIVVPSLLLPEVAGVIARTRQNAKLAHEYVELLIRLPFIEFVPLSQSLAMHAASIAAEHRLRGADAVYAAVSIAFGCKLVSLDHEHLARLPEIVKVFTPAQAISLL